MYEIYSVERRIHCAADSGTISTSVILLKSSFVSLFCCMQRELKIAGCIASDYSEYVLHCEVSVLQTYNFLCEVVAEVLTVNSSISNLVWCSGLAVCNFAVIFLPNNCLQLLKMNLLAECCSISQTTGAYLCT